MAPPPGRGSDDKEGGGLEATEGAAGGGAAEEEDVEVPLEQVETRGAAEEECAPSGSREEVEGPGGRLE